MKYFICDIDGTLAIMSDRSPYDWHRVGEDTPNDPVMRIVVALMEASYGMIFMSGRMEQARYQTELWLNTQIGQHHPEFCGLPCVCTPLFMRKDEDYRPDAVVKRELYETHVEPDYDIVGVIDDRNSVCRMWRDLGLTCLQVAEGNF